MPALPAVWDYKVLFWKRSEENISGFIANIYQATNITETNYPDIITLLFVALSCAQIGLDVSCSAAVATLPEDTQEDEANLDYSEFVRILYNTYFCLFQIALRFIEILQQMCGATYFICEVAGNRTCIE